LQKSKIEWCDMTWNPVTGCLHKCEYCYAKKQCWRFQGNVYQNKIYAINNCDYKLRLAYGMGGWILNEISQPVRNDKGRIVPFPFGFQPTLHKYRLGQPVAVKKPQNIFVVSMGDLFGEWVPEDWTWNVVEACLATPRHNYLFLTKNPVHLHTYGYPSNVWVGTSITGADDHQKAWDLLEATSKKENKFLSIEPLTHEIDLNKFELLLNNYKNIITIGNYLDWVIVGAMTGTGSAAHQPRREWVETIVRQCQKSGVPVFMKNSLQAVWNDVLIQEFPEELKHV
jgi:protein gp37